MKYFISVLQILTLTFLIISCKKESAESFNCDRFKQAVIENDRDRVAAALEGQLSSYSRENVNQLAGSISRQCSINVTVLCFDCVYTLPAQSELKISFTRAGATYDKILDVSSNSTNKMIIAGIHD